MSKDEQGLIDPTNLTLSQESELNAKSASVEGFEQKMAFEIYYKLGESRSLAKVAKQVGRSVKTLEGWSSKFRWMPRIKERERQAAEFLLMQKSAQEEAEAKRKHLTLIDAAIGKWAKKLTEDKIRLRSVEDIEKLIKLRWDLTLMADKKVNPSGLAQNGGMIDLQLRNMERKELQSFLYSTLKSIERVMNKKPIVGSDGQPVSGSQEKLNLNLSVSVADPNQKPAGSDEIIDIDTQSHDPLEMDLGDLEMDLNVDVDE